MVELALQANVKTSAYRAERTDDLKNVGTQVQEDMVLGYMKHMLLLKYGARLIWLLGYSLTSLQT